MALAVLAGAQPRCGQAPALADLPASAASDPGLAAEFVGAVDSFVPFWSPPGDELKRVRVVIDPAGGMAATAEARNRDDLCLWTASHLYHLVRNAGGYPSLRRVDDRPAGTASEETPSGDQSRVRRLFIRIISRPGATEKQVWPNSSEDAESCRLAEALLQAEGFGLRSEPRLEGAGITVSLPAVDPRRARVGDIPAHRAWAESIYRGLAAFVAAEQSQGSAGDDSTDESQPLVPYYPRHVPSSRIRRGAAAVWPDGNLPVAKAKWFCDMYINHTFSDRTNVHFAPIVTTQGQRVIIGGSTNHTVLLDTLENALRSVGLKDVRNEMRLLPEQGRLDPDRWFGACVVPMAMTYGRPAEGGSLRTQLLYGEAVFLLDREDGFFLVHASDGYLGWVRENCILPMSRQQFRDYTQVPEAVLLEDVATDDGRMVRNSRLRVTGAEDGMLHILLPDGRRERIDHSKARRIDDSALGMARARAALTLLHVPYLFAGKSSVGLDCSGLVGTTSDAYGYVLPRDAAQQFVSGSLVATRWYREGLRPGDRIYFLNGTGKIFHTGLSLGGRHFVHSSPPGVQINSLQEGDRLYRESWDRQFLGARRP